MKNEKLKINLIFLIIIGLILPSFAFLQEINQIPRAPETFKEAGSWWNSYILPWLKSIWQKLTLPFKKEIERRKPLIEEEFEKEKKEIQKEIKEEIKTETLKTGKSLWQRFKELLK